MQCQTSIPFSDCVDINKPITKLELSDRVNSVLACCFEQSNTVLSSWLTQFGEGLTSMDVAKAIEAHPETLQLFFCSDKCNDLSSNSCITKVCPSYEPLFCHPEIIFYS